MSREKQIEEMAGILASNCGNCAECDSFHKEINGIDACYHKYAEMIYNAGYRKQEWISVEERLPDGNGRFLTVDKKGDMMVCYWEKRFGWFASVCNKNAITHWMPLPEPPRGE